MNISLTRRVLRLGVKSLWQHKLRSLLTLLGIIFGVCSVIAMLAIGEGASQEAQDQIKKLGSQNIIIEGVKPPDEEKPTGSRNLTNKLRCCAMPAKTIRLNIYLNK